MHFRVRPLLFDQPLGVTIQVRAKFGGRVISPNETQYAHRQAPIQWGLGMDEVALGIDLGGTKTLVGVPGEAPLSAPTVVDFEESYRTVIELSRQVLAGRPCSGIGIAIGGPIDRTRRTVSPLHQTEWRDVPLWSLIKADLGIEPNIEVDTDAAAIAEASERSVSDLYYITWSTGVGGGYVREGQVHRAGGATGSSHPEFGHQIMPGVLGGSSEGCGRPACLESLIGGKALLARFGRPAPELAEEEWIPLEAIMAAGIVNAWTITGCPNFVLGGSIGIARFQGVRSQVERFQQDCSLAGIPVLESSVYGATASFEGALMLGGQTPAALFA